MNLFRRSVSLFPERLKRTLRSRLSIETLGPGPALLRDLGAELCPSLDLILSDYCHNRSSATFIQVGANDGVMNDPVFSLVDKYNLNGILIEPQPDIFRLLEKNYENKKSDRFILVNAAISSSDGRRNLYRIRPDPSIPDWVTGLASFDRDVILKHANWSDAPPDLESLIEIESVATITFPSLFEKYSINQVDILLIDVEGYDGEILRMFEVEKWLPSVIQFETKHLDDRTIIATLKRLVAAGYKVAANGVDALAYKATKC